MKVKNIMFFGFAAAILMGTANAAGTFQIASKAYVDAQVRTTSNSVGDMDNLNDGNNTNFGENTDTVVEALNDLDEAINTKQDALTAGDNIDITNNVISATYTTGTASASGLTKLYSTTGNNTDGAMTQAAVTSALGTLGTHVDPVSGETVPNTVADLLDDKQDKLGGGNDAGKVVTATSTAGTVDYTAIDTAVGTGSNLITSGAVKTYVDNAIQNVTGGGATIGVLDDGNGGTYNSVADALAAKQDKSDSTVDANDVTAANHLTAGAGVADNLVALGNALGTVEGTVGNSSAGLVHDVAELQAAVNGEGNTPGLDDRVEDLEDAINGSGNNQGLAADVSDLQTLTSVLSGWQSCVQNNSNDSGHCALTADENGMSWTFVTDPWIDNSEEPAGSH